jgi:transposase-like protein
VTIAEAARALGVDPRQVRRWLDQLDPKDKGQDTQKTHKGQPLALVRLSALETLKKGNSPHETIKGQRTGQSNGKQRTSSDSPLESPLHLRDTQVPILREIITKQEGEIAFLREALNKSQEVAAAALSRAEESDRRAAIMIAATATGQISGFSPRIDTSFSGTGGSETNATAKDEQEAASKVNTRPWWQFWHERPRSGGRG